MPSSPRCFTEETTSRKFLRMFRPDKSRSLNTNVSLSSKTSFSFITFKTLVFNYLDLSGLNILKVKSFEKVLAVLFLILAIRTVRFYSRYPHRQFFLLTLREKEHCPLLCCDSVLRAGALCVVGSVSAVCFGSRYDTWQIFPNVVRLV